MEVINNNKYSVVTLTLTLTLLFETNQFKVSISFSSKTDSYSSKTNFLNKAPDDRFGIMTLEQYPGIVSGSDLTASPIMTSLYKLEVSCKAKILRTTILLRKLKKNNGTE